MKMLFDSRPRCEEQQMLAVLQAFTPTKRVTKLKPKEVYSLTIRLEMSVDD